MTKYIGTTELRDGLILRISMQENPEGKGRDFYQLELNIGKKVLVYPKQFERYFSERDIWELHDAVKEKDDFIKILQNEKNM